LDEFQLTARYFAPLAREFPGAFGLLDDAAIFSPGAGNELVLKTDTIVAGIDFPPDELPHFVARKALRVNLSDLAAKGAVPRAYLLDLILPKNTDEAWIAGFAAGLADDQAEYGVHLLGGDTSSTSGPITVAITAIGEVRVGRMIRRNGARHGDIVFVTGTVGDAALGLEVLRGKSMASDSTDAEYLVGRYRLPQPRTMLGPRLIGIANAAIDVSDGLVADLHHICTVSRLSAFVDAVQIPLSRAARSIVTRESGCLATALTGGDDYEILFTAHPDATPAIRQLSQAVGVPITNIGRISALSGGEQPRVTVLDDERSLQLRSEGWTHFSTT
jgi:thiamine-monophosphate kinase